MNDQHDFEHLVADSVRSIGPVAPSDGAHELTSSRVRQSRQDPEWLALIKEPPMRSNSHPVVGSPTVRVMAVLAATMLLAVALAAAGASVQRLLAAGPIIVAADGSGDFTTIQEAVAAAEDGDEVLIRRGTYMGPVDIDKSISVRGEDRDGVVLEFGEGCTPTTPDDFMRPWVCPDETSLYDSFWFGDSPYGFLLRETTAELSDLTIRASPATEGSGIVIRGGAPTVSRVTFADVDGNLYVHAGSAAHIAESDLGDAWIFVEERSPATIEKSRFGAVVANTKNTSEVGGPSTIRHNTTYGIAFAGEAVVEGNVVVADEREPSEDGFYGQGIDVESGDDWVIRNNTVDGFADATGITVLVGGQGTISGNSLSGNKVGIGLLYGRHVIEANSISGGKDGIVILQGAAQLTDNVIEGVSGRGIAIAGPASPLLTGNESCGNGQNLYVADDAAPNIEASNEICEDAPAE